MKVRKPILNTMIAVLGLAIAFAASAHAQQNITEVDLDQDSRWDVTYGGRVYDAQSDQTTFTYVVTVYGNPALSHYTLGLPLCDTDIPLATYSPAGATVGLDPTTGVYGIKWDIGLDSGFSRTYTVTFMGNVGEGTIVLAVKAGTFAALGERPGPSCENTPPPGTYEISGTVFVDANTNGVLDPGEPLLTNTSVALYDSEGNLLATATTDAWGYYVFPGLSNGSYVVNVPSATDVEDFNEILDQYFSPSTPVSIDVVLSGADSTDNDFGFVPVIEDLEFQGTGKTIGFWKHQLKVASAGKGRAQVDVATVVGYVSQIEALFLIEPFQFGGSLKAALDVLQSTSSNPVDLLLKQLLATEFNFVAGWGLTGPYAQLQSVLVAWGEFLAANSESFSSSELLYAKDVFDAINNSGE